LTASHLRRRAATAPQRELLIDCHIESGRTGGSRLETAVPRCCFSNDITVSLLLLTPFVLLFGRSVNRARARRDRIGELGGATRPRNQDFRLVVQLQPVILKQHEARLYSRRQTLSYLYIRAVSRGFLDAPAVVACGWRTIIACRPGQCGRYEMTGMELRVVRSRSCVPYPVRKMTCSALQCWSPL
jgi:hypothetical protein